MENETSEQGTQQRVEQWFQYIASLLEKKRANGAARPAWAWVDPKTIIAMMFVTGAIAGYLLGMPAPEWLTTATAMILAFYYRDKRTRSATEEPGEN